MMETTRHTITRAEMEANEVAQVIASSSGGGMPSKQLLFVYNIGTRRLGYELHYANDVKRVMWFDDLDAAIAEYNEA
jgi:hypothetical protein